MESSKDDTFYWGFLSALIVLFFGGVLTMVFVDRDAACLEAHYKKIELESCK